MTTERWLKRLWFAIGVVLLPLALLLAGFLIYNWVDDLFDNNSEPSVAVGGPGKPLNPDSVHAVRYSLPDPIRFSRTSVVRVRYGTGSYSRDSYSVSPASYASDDYEGPLVNAVFIDSTGKGVHLLLDTPGYIRSIDVPEEHDSLQRWIVFEVSQRDTDGDGELSASDRSDLVLTDLDGRNKRTPLPDSLIYQHSMAGWERGTILIYALEGSSNQKKSVEARMRQRAFLYRWSTGELTPYTELESQTTAAAQLLTRP